MLLATCHCGAVRVSVPRRPRTVTDCNCSICRRIGALWAYYRAGDVRVEAAPGATEAYAWGDRTIQFVRCARCGCVTHWASLTLDPKGKMGVNARAFEPEVIARARVRRLDGASTWKYLDG